MEYYDQWKEQYPDFCDTKQPEGEINAALRKWDKDYYRCVEYLQEHKHSCKEILEKAVMRSFCSLKEAKYNDENTESDANEKRQREVTKDYLLSKYLRLICICLAICFPEKKELIKSAKKYEYFYSPRRLKSA